MIPRLHLPGPLRDGQSHELPADTAHHLCRVLRLGAGAPVQVFDGLGARHQARIETADPRRCKILIGPAQPSQPSGPLRITLAQCISAGDRMDWTIEKAVELGIDRIVPLLSQRSVVRLDGARGQRRVEHWQRIVVAACMQCGQDRIPPVDAPRSLDAWLAQARPEQAGLVLAPGATTALATMPAPATADVALLVGPESGLSDAECARAIDAGLLPVSLGPRVLRTETAGMTAIAVMQARFGDLRCAPAPDPAV